MPRRLGFTLIELTIAMAIGALVATVGVWGWDAATGARLREASTALTGGVKMNYDRAVMLRRVQRLVMDIDQGVWWIDYSDEPFALSASLDEGNAGASRDEPAEEEKEDSFFDDDIDADVKKALEGGKAARFQKDADLDAGKPVPLPPDTCFSRVWTGHQEEPFDKGVAYLHFFPGGFTEPAQIELVDVDCKAKDERGNLEGATYTTLNVMPLSGRVRPSDEQMEKPEVEEEVDGRDEGDL